MVKKDVFKVVSKCAGIVCIAARPAACGIPYEIITVSFGELIVSVLY